LHQVDRPSRSAENRNDHRPDQERDPGNYKAQKKGRDDRDPNGGFARDAFCRRNRMRLLGSFIGAFTWAGIRVSLGSTAQCLIHNAMCGSSFIGPTRTSSSAPGIQLCRLFSPSFFPMHQRCSESDFSHAAFWANDRLMHLRVDNSSVQSPALPHCSSRSTRSVNSTPTESSDRQVTRQARARASTRVMRRSKCRSTL
jgi:hypothetical protein